MEVDQPKPALQPDSSPGMPQTVAASGKGGEGIASRLWTLFREVSFYGVGIVLARSLSLLVTPVLTRLFSPSDFGLLDLLQTVGALAMLVISLRLESAVLRIYPGHANPSSLVTTYLVSLIVIGLTTFGILALLSAPLANLLDPSAHLQSLVVLMAFTSLATIYFIHGQTVLRAQRRVRLVNVAIVLNTALYFGLILFFAVHMRLGIASVFWAKALSDLAVGLAISFLIRGHYVSRPSWSMLRDFLAYCWPLILESFFLFVASNIGKFILLETASLHEVGIWAVVLKLRVPVLLLIEAFRQAWQPFAFSESKTPESPRLFSEAHFWYARGMLLFLIGYGFFAWEFAWLVVGPTYLEAAPFATMMVSASVITGLGQITGIGLFISKRVSLYTAAVISAAVIGMVASVPLTIYWGMNGLVLATILRTVIFAFLVTRWSLMKWPAPYARWPLTLFTVLALITMVGAAPVLNLPWPVRAVVVLLAALGLFGGPLLQFLKGQAAEGVSGRYPPTMVL